MADLVLRNGLVDVGAGEFRRADVGISGGRITAVDERVDGEDVVDCSRFAVVPGMVNAHCHSNENWFRGMWDNLPLEPWMLFSYPVLAAPSQTPEEIYVRTLIGAIEMVRSGTTCVVDFLYEELDLDALGAVVRAYRDVGLRALIGLGTSDRAYHETVVLDEQLVDADLLRELRAEQPPAWSEIEAYARAAVERFHRPDEGIAIALAPSGPQRCTDEMLTGCARLAEELDLTIHIHVLETRMQAVSAQRMYGRTLPEHLDALGFLSPRVSFEHGVWLTQRDIELVRDAGVTIVHNPVSNLKLGSGICAVPTLLRDGVNVALGTDGMSSNDGNDMLWALKLAALLHKVWEIDYEEWLGAQEAWQMATIAGAESAGHRDDLGRIAPGLRADIVLLDLDGLEFTPLNDPLRQLALGATSRSVAASLVGGRWVLRDGAVTGIDEAAVLAEARERGRDVVRRHDAGFETGRRLLAPLRAGWLEALRTNVGVRRSLPL